MPITTPDNLITAYHGDKDHFKHVLEVLFEPALAEIGYEVWRPSAKGSDLIHEQIIRQLETADLVLCDMSTLNANVFFELGIRTALDKPVSLVRDEITAHIPFDTGVLNYHTYSAALNSWSVSQEIARLAAHLRESMSGSENRNTMWRRFGLTIRAGLPEEQNPGDAKLNLIIEETTALSRAVGNLTGHGRGDRVGGFFADALDSISDQWLADISLEPHGDYAVTATMPAGTPPYSYSGEKDEIARRLIEIGLRNGIKVNIRYP